MSNRNKSAAAHDGAFYQVETMQDRLIYLQSKGGELRQEMILLQAEILDLTGSDIQTFLVKVKERREKGRELENIKSKILNLLGGHPEYGLDPTADTQTINLTAILRRP